VDPHRAWYQGGSPADFQSTYLDRLQQYTQQYDKVVMIGDSMGATAALLCSPHATSVLSFCPQVIVGRQLRLERMLPGNVAAAAAVHAVCMLVPYTGASGRGRGCSVTAAVLTV
jgi:hypothetical protein